MSEPGEPVLLLTNDDGVDAPGMHALCQAADGLGQCRVIAPSGPISGCGHQVTTHQPIEIVARDDGTLAVKGSPADCVRLAIHEFVPEAQWVLSGINAGGNLGTDTYISGTVAAAREAAIRGLPAIAISHYIARGRLIDWPARHIGPAGYCRGSCRSALRREPSGTSTCPTPPREARSPRLSSVPSTPRRCPWIIASTDISLSTRAIIRNSPAAPAQTSRSASKARSQ